VSAHHRKSITIAIFLLSMTLPSIQPADAFQNVDPDHAKKMIESAELFKTEVRQIFVGRCLKCHGGKSTEGDFDMTSRENLLESEMIVPGKPAESVLYQVVTHQSEPLMPEDGAKLEQRSLDHIKHWIELGAAYDKPLIDKDDTPWIERTIEPSARNFWSFQPLASEPVPQIQDDAWSKNEIDRFVLQKLREANIEPLNAVDRRKFIRRAYLDLIGLPPTPAEIEAFVNDPAENATEKLLDRLLENPHYGERWGRHWLDVARFAESHGFEQDYDRPHAYHFRDFVIRALNSDMPFDQFVRWQIAGDEIAPEVPDALMATGFLGAGVFPTQLTEKEFESARYDELDDMVATLGTSMLGVTIGCARCHDHKFDPIPAADYYRMVATFATTIRSEIEIDIDPEKTKTELAVWQSEQEALIKTLADFEQRELPQRFDTWLQSDPKIESIADRWLVLDFDSLVSAGGTTLSKLEDGSILAAGTNPDFDVYTFTSTVHLPEIRAIRLEALADESLVRKGPGRANNGNFGLSKFSVFAEPLDGNGDKVEIKLVEARATFEQNNAGLSIASSLDDQPKTGWAVDPKFGANHAAIFVPEKPFGFPEGTKLTFVLDFHVNNHHQFGRTRISLSDSVEPLDFFAEQMPQATAELAKELSAIKTAEKTLTEDQRNRLLKFYRGLDPQWQKLNAAIIASEQQKPKPQLTKVMVSSENVKPIPHHGDGRGFPHFYPETHFLNRGDAAQKQAVATQGFLQVLTRIEEEQAKPDQWVSLWRQTPPEKATTSYRRTTLANWLTDVDRGAGQLLARVIVNRLWQHHMGRGIVSTTNDFGFQGARPTHPELLDWLAQRLIEEGWRLKPIHKLIMTSAVYAQSSQFDAARAQADPDNKLFWRSTPKRLEAEIIRDAMLAISGQLEDRMFGPGTLDESMRRRSIYFMIKRSQLIPSMQVFDAPEPLVSVGDRPTTTIAPQALMFMNSKQVRGYASGFAEKLLPAVNESLDDAIRQGYQIAIARDPTAKELAENRVFIQQQIDSYQQDSKNEAKRLALTDFCQVLFCLNEFVYLD
jgi:cytochrome c553